MIVDYWIIRRGNFHVPSLYNKEEGPYSYYKGWNFRAVVAWVAGVAFTVHGVAGNLDPDSVATASKNMYKLGFLLSLLMGSAVYYALCLIWPPPLYAAGTDGPTNFEGMADSEGFFEGESADGIRMVLDSSPEFDPTVHSHDQKASGAESTSEKLPPV
jgi:NCS1 family nucleobase:cation symporter-1